MKVEVFRKLEEAQGRFGPCALAIGNFDGVHIGHRALLGETVRYARANGLSPAALTFDPHPTLIVAPTRVPRLICSVEERIRLLADVGIERIYALNFTADTARLTPAEFVSQILVDSLDTGAVFVGDNFRFGVKQGGTCEVLRELGYLDGFSSHFLRPVTLRGKVVSSTAIRKQLAEGDVVNASRFLGRCFSIGGAVVSGRGIGSTQAVPTLNVSPDSDLLIPHGIYVTETRDPATDRHWPSVTSCGYNPTFGATDLTIETYLLGAFDGLTPTDISVRFRHFLRREQTYPDAATLKVQIIKDVARAEAYWRHTERLQKATSSIY